MNKKVISAIMAGAMALSTMGVSSFAATSGDKEVTAAGQTTFKISAAVAAPVISVTVPSNVAAVINPYGVSINIKGQTDPVGAGGVSSVTYKIVNKTTASKIKVSATPTITVPTAKVDGETTATMTVTATAAAAEAVTDADKKAIYAAVVSKVENNAVADGDTKVTNLLATDWATATPTATVPFVDITTTSKDDLATVQANAKKGLMVLPKATAEDKTDPDNVVAATNGYGVFAVTGAVSPNSDWTTKDKVTLNLVLDIGPCADDATV